MILRLFVRIKVLVFIEVIISKVSVVLIMDKVIYVVIIVVEMEDMILIVIEIFLFFFFVGDICNMYRFDFFMMGVDGKMYVFSGDYFWVLLVFFSVEDGLLKVISKWKEFEIFINSVYIN